MYLVAWNASQGQTEWATLYKRLVPRLCTYDERLQAYERRGKAIAHVIGSLLTLIYALLRQDHETLNHLPLGTKPPEPVLSDAELHRLWRQ